MFASGDHSQLKQTVPPSDAEPEHLNRSCRVEAYPQLALPDSVPEIEFGTSAYTAYQRLCEEIEDIGTSEEYAVHRLLGHPQTIQNPMELECQLASHGIYCGSSSGFQGEQAEQLKSGAADWRLLLQIDTDEDGPGWIWGDVGRIYFWIKKQDLTALRFDDVWLVFQCY